MPFTGRLHFVEAVAVIIDAIKIKLLQRNVLFIDTSDPKRYYNMDAKQQFEPHLLPCILLSKADCMWV